MKTLDCKNFKQMLVSGGNNLLNKIDDIDKLNVFPVPDGDTGTNMNMTFSSGVKETVNYMNDNIGDTAKYLSKNMLMGARGNSGVILSQIFKGIAKSISGKDEINAVELADAFVNGYKVAYKAVMRPVEGTILTVARESADCCKEFVTKNPNATIEECIEVIAIEADAALQRTPEQLTVLAEAGVVDSGGAGYCAIIEGFNAYCKGTPIEDESEKKQAQQTVEGYCCEVSVALNEIYHTEFSQSRLERSLGRTCASIKIFRNQDVVNIHVHTLTPGMIITTAERFGDLMKVKVERLAEEHHYELEYEAAKAATHKKYSLISVCNGEGVQNQFKELGVDYIINGGQTMNPSTEDFCKVINESNCDHIFIFPNNSNIILAANQAKDMCKGQDVIVIPTKSIPQGISACINFNFEGEVEENESLLNEVMSQVTDVSITQAVKNTTYNSLEIHEGDYMGIIDKDIVVAGTDMMSVIHQTIDHLDDSLSYLTIIYGKDTDEATANEVLEYAIDKFDIEGEVIDGKQDLYPFIIGAE